MTRSLSLLSVVVWLVVVGGIAHAQGDAPAVHETGGSGRTRAAKRAAKAFADKASREYNLERYPEAIADFEKAYEIDPAPILLFDIAQVHRKAGNSERALSFYRRYVQQAPDAPNRGEAETRIQDLQRQLQTQSQKPAEEPPPRSPDAAATSAKKQSEALPDQSQDESASRNGTSPPPASPGHTGHGAGYGMPRLRTAAWVTAGASVAALGIAIVLQVSLSHKLDAFNRSCRLDSRNNDRPTPFPDPTASSPDCQSLYDAWNEAQHWPTIGYLVTGALAVTTGVLFVGSSREKTLQAHVDCRFGPGFASCGGIF